MDERRDARTGRLRRRQEAQGVPHRVHRRRDAGDPLRRLRPLREHRRLPAGPQGGRAPPRRGAPPFRRQRERLPLAPARARLREARHHAHPRPALPCPGEGEDRALVSDRSAPAPPAAPARRSRKPRRAQPAPLDLGRGRVPPLPAPRSRRRDAARQVGPGRRRGPLPRPRPRRPLPQRGEAEGREGPDREPRWDRLRGRRRARRRGGHAAPRSVEARPHGAGVGEGQEGTGREGGGRPRELLRPAREARGAPPRRPREKPEGLRLADLAKKED